MRSSTTWEFASAAVDKVIVQSIVTGLVKVTSRSCGGGVLAAPSGQSWRLQVTVE